MPLKLLFHNAVVKQVLIVVSKVFTKCALQLRFDPSCTALCVSVSVRYSPAASYVMLHASM